MENVFCRVNINSLICRLINDCFDDIILIDCATGKVLNVTEQMLAKERRPRLYYGLIYDVQLINTISDRFPNMGYDKLKNEMLLSTVIKSLERNSEYCVQLFNADSTLNEPIFKEIKYSYLDSHRDIIIMVCQDISGIVASENDPLTGLYNSTGFHRHVHEWIDNNPGKRYRIHRYNIDRFRDINGIYGYDTANKLLRDIGFYMKSYDCDDSFSAHLSADHFVRFCKEGTLTVTDCYDNFTECFKNYGLNMPIKMHMGVYDLCEPDCDSYTMSYKALLALQSLKGNLKTSIAYYESGMMAVETEHQALLADVEKAIADEEFEVWYQPQFDFKQGRLIGAEALIRWRHHSKGMISPAVFIPLFEKSGIISSLDKYVFERACADLQRWQAMSPDGSSLPLSVNLSRKDLYRTNLCSRLDEILNEHGLSASDINLEITESAYIDSSKVFLDNISKLRNMGFRVEMDDFGSGYSSLNSLKDISIDKLKLDMKFIAGTAHSRRGKIILSAVVNMAKELDLPVIAEGVETLEQANMLLDFGCDQMQGYYFSRPIVRDEYESLMRRHCVIR